MCRWSDWREKARWFKANSEMQRSDQSVRLRARCVQGWENRLYSHPEKFHLNFYFLIELPLYPPIRTDSVKIIMHGMTNAFLFYLFWSGWINNFIKKNVIISTPYPQNWHWKRQKRKNCQKSKLILFWAPKYLAVGHPSIVLRYIFQKKVVRTQPFWT